MDHEVLRHQRRIDAAGEWIDGLERADPRATARLRRVHERVRSDFARLRQAFADDWHRMKIDAAAGWRELADEMGSIDSTLLGWYEDELVTLDQTLHDVTIELERTHAADAGRAELRAQIEEAKRRRQAIGSTPPSEQRAAVERYSTAVQDVLETWRRHSWTNDQHVR
jgi:hypothetical protein